MKSLQLVDHRGAAIGPEHGTGRKRMEEEQVELLAEHPVVALLRLLDPIRCCVELVLLEEGRSIDALQHLALRVAPPVGAGTV